jgi:CysZ protein
MFPLMKTLKSFKEAKLVRYIIYDILIALLVGGIFVFLATYYSDKIVTLETDWLRSLLKYFTGTMAVVISWFMLPVLIPLIAGIFEETIIKRVEDTYYPDEKEKKARFWPDFLHDIKFTLVSLFLNILVIPWYFFGIGFVVSLILNSYLLGREFFESAAGYSIGKPEASKLKNRNQLKVYTGGFIITIFTLTPVLNLIVPIVAIVWMVHLYHAIEVKETNKRLKKQERIEKIAEKKKVKAQNIEPTKKEKEEDFEDF